MGPLLFLFLCVLSVVVVVVHGSELEHESLKACMKESLTEAACLDGLRSEVALPFKHSDLSSAIKKGWWEVAKEVILLGKHNGMDFESEVDMEHRVLKQKMDTLKATAKQSGTTNDNFITPAFQWAQSKDTLFLEVKFAHKMDAPSYAHAKISNITFTADTMNMTASGKDKSFKLNLRFFKDIVPENCTWSASSAGRVTVTVPKKGGDVSWSRPLKGKQPHNMLVWWAMKEKFEKEMNEVEKPKSKAKNTTKAAGEDKKEDTSKEDANKDEGKKSTPQSESQKQLQASLKKLTEEAKEKIDSYEKEARAQKKVIDEDAKLKKSEIEKDFKEFKSGVLKEAAGKKSTEKAKASASDDSHEEL